MKLERRPVESDRANWRAGQRVSCAGNQELGIVVEAGRTVKVKWDDGRTSYYRPEATANARLKELTGKAAGWRCAAQPPHNLLQRRVANRPVQNLRLQCSPGFSCAGEYHGNHREGMHWN